ncbi:MAG TPA: hydroxymethylglutaryl-CoA lyase [Alphaproteobacteria bacterium]|nr:hydroxymethylglutaryl-CoA lyase [Alphaproteobacteria bacterium]
MAPQSVTLVEVGLRDGLQNERVVFSTNAKIEFARRLAASGVRRMEATSFVNPARVPQMADAEALMANLPRGHGVSYIGLVLNQRGFERAVAAGCDEIGFVIVASDSFSRRNQGMGTSEGLALWHLIAAEAADRGIKASVMISAACGCPFEGRVPVARVLELAAEVVKSPAIELAIADTIGVGVPTQVTAIVEGARRLAEDRPIRVHFHNTRNTAIANIAAAIAAGASIVDASAGGIGGCPFAPRATGNVATEDVLYMLHHMGIETGVSLAGAIETARWLEEQLGRPVPGLVSKAGDFPAEPARDAA